MRNKTLHLENTFSRKRLHMTLQELFISTMAGAAVVLTGAFYAMFYALAKMNDHRGALAASTFSYFALVVAVFVLIEALHLQGFWLFVAAVMLVGYFVAPRAIWRLSVDIHEAPGSHEE